MLCYILILILYSTNSIKKTVTETTNGATLWKNLILKLQGNDLVSSPWFSLKYTPSPYPYHSVISCKPQYADIFSSLLPWHSFTLSHFYHRTSGKIEMKSVGTGWKGETENSKEIFG